MEKSKKEKKSEKVIKTKEVKVKEIKKDNDDIDDVVLRKNEKNVVKFIGLMSSFFAAGLAILIFIFGIITCISAANLPKETLLNNNIVVTFISKMNNYTVSEVHELITNMSNRLTFVLFEIVIPAIAFIGSMILIIVLAKRIIEFVSDITYDKDLYTRRKLDNSLDIISILSVVLLTMLVIFNEPSIIVYLLIEALLWIVYLLFKKSVLMRKK